MYPKLQIPISENRPSLQESASKLLGPESRQLVSWDVHPSAAVLGEDRKADHTSTASVAVHGKSNRVRHELQAILLIHSLL